MDIQETEQCLMDFFDDATARAEDAYDNSAEEHSGNEETPKQRFFESEYSRNMRCFCGDAKLSRYWADKKNEGEGDGR